MEAVEKYSETPINRRLKIIAILVIALGILLMGVMFIWYDKMSVEMALILQGCVGLCAIVFVVLTGVIMYRSYSSLWNDKVKTKPRIDDYNQ